MSKIPKQKQELLEQFFATMIKIRRYMDQLSNISIEDKVATALQMQALSFLQEHPMSTVGDLAQTLNMSSSSIAQLTDRLANAKLVSRKNDKNDRRVVRLILSQTGEKELVSTHKKILQKMSGFLDYISESDLKQMVEIHQRVLTNLENKKHN